MQCWTNGKTSKNICSWYNNDDSFIRSFPLKQSAFCIPNIFLSTKGLIRSKQTKKIVLMKPALWLGGERRRKYTNKNIIFSVVTSSMKINKKQGQRMRGAMWAILDKVVREGLEFLLNEMRMQDSPRLRGENMQGRRKSGSRPWAGNVKIMGQHDRLWESPFSKVQQVPFALKLVFLICKNEDRLSRELEMI